MNAGDHFVGICTKEFENQAGHHFALTIHGRHALPRRAADLNARDIANTHRHTIFDFHDNI